MLFDERARAVPGVAAQVKYAMRATPDGGADADADEMLGYVENAIDQVLAQAGDRADRLAAVASASLASNLLGVDANGRAVTPAFTYADTRGAREVAELRARLDERAIHQRVGAPFHTSYLPARLLWLARERAQMFQRARYWMSLGEYFLFRWTGQRACSYSVASWTGLLNRKELAWDAELLSALPISADQLSRLVDHDQPVGALRGEYAARWSTLRNAKWFPTIGDGAAANVGSGCVDTSRIALTIGTSSALRLTHPLPPPSPDAPRQEREGFPGEGEVPWGLWAYRVDKDHELAGGALNEGGSFFKWARSLFNFQDIENPEAEAGKLAPDSHGLTVLPFLSGERSPNWNAAARAAIVGLTWNTRPIDVWRAGLEAIAYRLGVVFELLRAFAPNAREVIASGGAMVHSPVWQQIIADTLNAPVIVSAEPEATSRGAALLALKALGVIQSLGELPARTGAVFAPDAARHEIYKRAMERQAWLYQRIVRDL